MDCDVSLYDVAVSLLTYVGTWHLTGGFEAKRTARSAHPSLVPFQNCPTADGWIVVGCAKEKFWQRLASTIGHPELSTEPRFTDFTSRRANVEELILILDEAFKTHRTERWLARLKEAGVPCGPVSPVADALASPLTEARGMIVSTEHPPSHR